MALERSHIQNRNVTLGGEVFRVQSSSRTPGTICPLEDCWNTISSDRAGHQEFEKLIGAEKAFELNCSLARFIWFCRVVDDHGNILRYYNPQLDERLPGCLWRLKERAEKLWKEDNRPKGRDSDFWFEAKRQIEQETSNLGGNPIFSEYGDLER